MLATRLLCCDASSDCLKSLNLFKSVLVNDLFIAAISCEHIKVDELDWATQDEVLLISYLNRYLRWCLRLALFSLHMW